MTLRNILQSIIRQKNPDFKFHRTITNGILLELIMGKIFEWIRAKRLLFYGVMPRKIFFGRGVKLFNGRNIQWGSWIQVGEGTYLSALGEQPLQLGNNVRIGAYSRLIISITFNNPGAYIRIGNNVGLGEFSNLGGAGGLTIGDDCIIGQFFSCHPENHIFEQGGLTRQQGVRRAGISIGKNCWIGSKVTILDGVTIGDNCVIAAGAVVTKSFPPNSLIGGLPAKILKSIPSHENDTRHRLRGQSV